MQLVVWERPGREEIQEELERQADPSGFPNQDSVWRAWTQGPHPDGRMTRKTVKAWLA
jgi:hypothetical protein